MVTCRACHEPIPEAARYCSQCGERQEERSRATWIAERLLSLAIVGGMFGLLLTGLYFLYAAVMRDWVALCLFAPILLLNQLGLLVLFIRARQMNFAGKQPRSFFQFRLRSLLVAVTVLAAFLSWYVANARERALEKRAIARITGSVKPEINIIDVDQELYCLEPSAKIYASEPIPPWIRRFLDRLEIDAFYRVESVYLDIDEIDDSVILSLKEFKSAKTITLLGTRVTDEAVAELQAELPQAEIRTEPKPQGGGFF